MSGDYDTDVLLWSERQAELLRRHAATTTTNADIDWPNVIEEIESVGRDQLRAVESLLMRALVHLLKAQAWPQSGEAPHWLAEARIFRADAANRYVPSMRQRIDLARIYRRALRGVPETIDGQPGLPVPNVCLVSLEEVLADD